MTSAVADVEPTLRALSRAGGLLGAATPIDAHVERARLLADYAAGHDRLPQWEYGAASDARAEQVRRLDEALRRLRGIEGTWIGRLYRDRAVELRQELLAADAVGTRAFADLAAIRFASGDDATRAGALAEEWCDGARDEDAPGTLVSDDRDPRSLASRLRAEVARRRLPFTVRTSASMSALAAISGDTLWVAAGRTLSERDVDRTVLHEIEAHAMPRVRARDLTLGIFGIGTARGSDDQEGYALWLEERRGVSSASRRKELGARHIAVSLMRQGADFVAVVRALRERRVSLAVALRVAERAFRGSDGRTPGLGRESVYLEAYLRVGDWLTRCPGDEAVLAAGQVAVSAVEMLRPWVERRAEPVEAR
jgi:hypothetical protein